jgi:hypothetical protein
MEVCMDVLLLVIALAVGVLLARMDPPAPRPHIIAINTEVPPLSGDVGCLPLLIIALAVVLILSVVRF